MKTISKIRQLWSYLSLQDDETLIVKVYDKNAHTDRFIVADIRHGNVHFNVLNDLPETILVKPFHLLQQRDSKGMYVIPSVKQLNNDLNIDY